MACRATSPGARVEGPSPGISWDQVRGGRRLGRLVEHHPLGSVWHIYTDPFGVVEKMEWDQLTNGALIPGVLSVNH